ncbi:aldehyde dehydrogenase family protein [Streptomyces decoyicus]|uniref:aldehyde dehydrogenase family protein n=1 Tax=Streptomyces decoyicus TaxID=249567 RepID=UPI002E17B935|nr:aldehyde dehydrogenase family protein [Streptomyces decoyicus]
MNHLQVEDSVKESFCAGFPNDREDEIAPVARTVRQAAPREYHSFVGGVDVPSDNGVYCMSARAMLNDVFATLRAKRALERGKGDPGNPNVLARCSVADSETARAAVKAAAEAFPQWAAAPARTRVFALGRAVRRRLEAHRSEIIEVLVQEQHPRVLAEWQFAGLLGGYSEENLQFYAGQLHMEFSQGPRRMLVRRQPDGVVCANPPQNAPLSSVLLAAAAMLAGNTLVVRVPRSAPLGAMYVLREILVPALEEAGAPPGTLNFFCAAPQEVLESWLNDPAVADIFYIGPSDFGLRLEAKCVAHGKKPILELAGNDGVAIWRDAHLDRAVQALTECFLGSGQICMVPNYAVVHPDIADELLRRLGEAVDALRPGYPDDPKTLLSPVVRSEKFFAFLDQAVGAGAQLLRGGHRIEVDGTVSDNGPFLQPTVLRVDGLAGARRVDAVREETFFPLLPVVVAEPGDDEHVLGRMVAFLNENAYGLRNSVWARERRVVDRFVRDVRNGGLLKVNDSHVGFLPCLPTHGGTGLTGGVYGEANYPPLRTSRLQGVSVAHGVNPRDAVFGSSTTDCTDYTDRSAS